MNSLIKKLEGKRCIVNTVDGVTGYMGIIGMPDNETGWISVKDESSGKENIINLDYIVSINEHPYSKGELKRREKEGIK